ncbi:type II toxin-antitoxin system Phd/YefM family antitoxin [Curtobacterium ammoniigenes]|uniref:type II toxin-antitoxin system Phd/YefM family antitoxin n=1 Tax=Curtobacterium ammoniigenes TaxID=395387 RepID=UPI0009FA808C|nr:type II toxin-antitoxin system prevent-host-death family antitoxin [Curtobacterium ammoniigenes]
MNKVGDLRRNSAEMIDDVEAGDEYVLARNGREVARVVPVAEETRWTHNGEGILEVLKWMSSPDLADLVDEARLAEQSGDL